MAKRGGAWLVLLAVLLAGCGGAEEAAEPALDAGEEVADAAEDAAAEEADVAVEEPDAAEEADVELEDAAAEGCASVWVPVVASGGRVEIFAYEASRADATATSAGVARGGACGVAGVVPWTGVSWDEATAACAASGARLCSGEEWDEGCVGEGEASYPYGNTYEPAACNVLESPDGCLTGRCRLVPGGSYAGCLSGAGAWDMSGNAAEWVATPRSFGEEVYEVRGGSYTSGPDATIRCRNAHRWEIRDYREEALGFRCCRPAR